MEEEIKDSKVTKSLAEEVKEFCDRWGVRPTYIYRDLYTEDFVHSHDYWRTVHNPYFYIDDNSDLPVLLATFYPKKTTFHNECLWYDSTFVKEFKQLAKKVREYDT